MLPLFDSYALLSGAWPPVPIHYLLCDNFWKVFDWPIDQVIGSETVYGRHADCTFLILYISLLLLWTLGLTQLQKLAEEVRIAQAILKRTSLIEPKARFRSSLYSLVGLLWPDWFFWSVLYVLYFFSKTPSDFSEQNFSVKEMLFAPNLIIISFYWCQS